MLGLVNSRRPLRTAASLLLVLGVTVGWAGTGAAHYKNKHKPWDHHDDRGRGGKSLEAVPFVFVGRAGACTPNSPAGSNIVTSAWLEGMGLPDNGRPNSPNPNARRDPHDGLLLNKNGPTTDCSSAGAIIKGFKSGSRLRELGFDYRFGGHCGAGAPRFNITTMSGDTFFAGCANGTQRPAPQDPQWTRVRFDASSAGLAGFSFGQNGTPVRSITIIFDEGTDSTSGSDPTGVGLAVIDNIRINGQLITNGQGIVPKPDNGRGKDKGKGHGRDDDDNDRDDDDHDDDDDDDNDDDD